MGNSDPLANPVKFRFLISTGCPPNEHRQRSPVFIIVWLPLRVTPVTPEAHLSVMAVICIFLDILFSFEYIESCSKRFVITHLHKLVVIGSSLVSNELFCPMPLQDTKMTANYNRMTTPVLKRCGRLSGYSSAIQSLWFAKQSGSITRRALTQMRQNQPGPATCPTASNRGVREGERQDIQCIEYG
jgi:hypothetical protein